MNETQDKAANYHGKHLRTQFNWFKFLREGIVAYIEH